MIVFFGPAGAGKSIQGQMLAARMGWRWLSAGQLLRETKDIEISRQMHEGVLIDPAIVNKIMGEALKRSSNVPQVILDGWPRQVVQAEWLLSSKEEHGRSVDIVIALDVARDELLKRLEIRGRSDDTAQAIDERLSAYEEEMYPVLDFMTGKGIPVAHVDGVGSVGQIHDRIFEELSSRGLV